MATNEHQHREFDPHHFMSMEAKRKSFMPPDEILSKIIVGQESNFVDVGCGPGFFTLPAATMLPKAKIYAVDRQQNMVDLTLSRAKEASLDHISGIVTPSSALPFDDHSIDIVFMSMVYHDVIDPVETLAEIKRVLRPQGKFYLVEWDKVESELGPPLAIRITPDELQAHLHTAGFTVTSIERSSHHVAVYFVLATPSA